MPVFADEERNYKERAILTNNGDINEDDDPSFVDLTLATFRTENSIVSAFSAEKGLPTYGLSKDYNPWEHLTDEEKADDLFLDNAMLSNNDNELAAVRNQTAKERVDRDTMSKGGAMSFFLGFAAGTIDPINLIPVGGTAYKTYRGGSSILRSAMITGSVASGSTAAQEAALHHSQIERTYGESAVNMSAAFFLGGVLGGGLEMLAKRGVTPELIKEVEHTFNQENTILNGGNSALGESAGAAKVYQDVQIKGAKVRVFAKAVAFDPLTRALTSDAPFSRSLANDLAENPYDVDGGITTAVESLIKIHDGKYISAVEVNAEQYKLYQKEIGGSTGIKRLINRKGLTRKEFSEEVGKEQRNPSSKASPYIKKAAATWEAELYAPIRLEAQSVKILSEDIKVTTAKQYLNRVWNKEKLTIGLPRFIKGTSKWLSEQDVKAGKAVDAEDYDDLARQIADRILGTPDGMLPYDWKLGEGSANFGVPGIKLSGPLQPRVFDIPDRLIEDFLENDIELLGARYLKQMAPDIELTRKFGNVSMDSQLSDVTKWWDKQIEAAEGEKTSVGAKKALKLKAERSADYRDLAGMRDRIRGVYGRPEDPDSVFIRAMRSARDLNYVSKMGGVVASSFPDVARTFMAEGFANTLKYGFKPLIKNLKTFKIAAAEGRRYGIASESLLGGRGEIMADVADYTQRGTKLEKGLRGMTDSFGKINLMDKWTTAMKQLHVVTMQTSIIEGLSKGKIDKRLKRLGISDDNALAMFEQVQKHGGFSEGVWISGARKWDSPELEKMWGAALRKESDRVIVMPGQEKPLFMSREMGKTFMQFRSFMFSSTQRMLIAGLQGQDHNYFGGTLMITAMGMMSYSFKQWDAGRDIAENPKEMIIEGIDRSGSLGVLMEMNNTIEKMSNNNHGLRPYLGVKSPAARFASRSVNQAVLGPTFGGLLDTVVRVASAGTDDNPWTDADTRALRRLLPYQNLTFIRQIFDKLEGK